MEEEVEEDQEHIYQKMENQANFDHQSFMFPSEIASPTTNIFQPWPLYNDSNHPSSLPPLQPPPPHPSSIYGDLYNSPRASYNNNNNNSPLSSEINVPLGLGSLYSSSSSVFESFHAELMSKISAREIMVAKEQAASKNHSEAERRRRERINGHYATLRSMLPSTTKMDKASLLAEVIQHLKELKRQTSEMAEENTLPTEIDELTVDPTSMNDDGKFIVKVSLCCEDRIDLIPDLLMTLKALRMRTLNAEITTVGGRVKYILVITGDDDSVLFSSSIEITASFILSTRSPLLATDLVHSPPPANASLPLRTRHPPLPRPGSRRDLPCICRLLLLLLRHWRRH